jgi:hypothetical protein
MEQDPQATAEGRRRRHPPGWRLGRPGFLNAWMLHGRGAQGVLSLSHATLGAINGTYRSGPKSSRFRKDGADKLPRMAGRSHLHSSSTRVLSIVMIVIGIALIVRTLVAGGSALATGIVLGVLFVLAGLARLYLQRRG